jgi:hypothetical protein
MDSMLRALRPLRSRKPSTLCFIFLSSHVLACSGGAHEGGTVSTEPFHLTFKAAKADGTLIPTQNPHTNKSTVSHHFYVASDKEDLKAKAAKWASGNST